MRWVKASAGRPSPIASASATVATAASIRPPHPSITGTHSGKAAGTTGGALSSLNRVSIGRSPSRQKKRHLRSAPEGGVGRCAAGSAAAAARMLASRRQRGFSMPSGVAPTW